MANEVAYGFQNLESLFDERITEERIPVVETAIRETIEEHNRQISALTNLFVERTTDHKVRFLQEDEARLQPLDENGRARPIQVGGYYDVAFPIWEAGTAFGANYVAGRLMTIAEANRLTNKLVVADMNWMRDQILGALFTNSSYTFNDPQYGALTVYGLANGDDVVYNRTYGGRSTDNHYLAQADSIADNKNPFPVILEELMEHPVNGGEVVAFIPSNLRSSVEGLATFYPPSDPNIQPGIGESRLVGTLGLGVPGRLLGYEASGVWIVEWKPLPENYIVAVATDGPRPLRMREYPNAELQGFRRLADRNDHPWYEQQYARWCGFGSYNRVGAVVMQIGSSSYSVPTGYAVPMP